MKKGKFLSFKKSIKDDADISMILKEMAADWSQIPKNLIETLIERFEGWEPNSCPIQPYIMEDIIVIFKNPQIFRIFVQKKWFPKTPSFYIKALKKGLNSKHIEFELCEFLDRELKSRDGIYVREILSVLRDFGSIDCLDELQRLEYDFEKRVSDARRMLDSPLQIDEEQTVEKALDYQTFRVIVLWEEALSKAIQAIIKRDEPLNEDWLIDFEDFNNLNVGYPQEQALDDEEKVNATISDLLERGEDKRLEFKESLRGGGKSENTKRPEWRVCRAIASFANTDGGILLLGVCDNGNPIGISNDFKSVNGEKDEYQLRLNQVLAAAFTDAFTPQYVDISFHKIESFLICRVDVRRSDSAVFLKTYNGREKQFWVRNSGQTTELKNEDLATYLKNQWPG